MHLSLSTSTTSPEDDMIQLRDVHLADGAIHSFTQFAERLDYAQLEIAEYFGAANFAFLTDSGDVIVAPDHSVKMVRMDTRQRIQRISSKPVDIRVIGVGEFKNSSVIDRADYSYANVPHLFAPQLVWSCESGTYIANIAHVGAVVESARVRTSKVVPRNALHVKNSE
jgi:hypothetical protein